jgi:hypothetical protein
VRGSRPTAHNLHRERPANDLIEDIYVEIIVALDTLDHLLAHLCGSSMDNDVNLLLSLAV